MDVGKDKAGDANSKEKTLAPTLEGRLHQIIHEVECPDNDPAYMYRLCSTYSSEINGKTLLIKVADHFYDAMPEGEDKNKLKAFLSEVEKISRSVSSDELPLLIECVTRGVQHWLNLLRSQSGVEQKEDMQKNLQYLDSAIEKAEKTSWGRRIGGALLVLAGAAIIAGSVFAIMATFGTATPLVAIIGLKAVTSLMAAAVTTKAVAAVGVAAGMGAVGGGFVIGRPRPIAKISTLVSALFDQGASKSAKNNVSAGESMSKGLNPPSSR